MCQTEDWQLVMHGPYAFSSELCERTEHQVYRSLAPSLECRRSHKRSWRQGPKAVQLCGAGSEPVADVVELQTTNVKLIFITFHIFHTCPATGARKASADHT